ncbi:sister chromatid cohesion protein PDS5 homolog C isoform X2 [Elaeis guineensis]|uniref:Uncharacterized protein LOC105060200 isoform X2 n=1 Tax=Elaeis guineensis var. tenera TaxID=51953 RepID=A0A6I9SDX6_ELAGV|nr:uncharacterized protein LOC105060200 isoform X2 [Elaeis guineensis]
MASTEELEDRLQEVGNRLASRPSAIDELLPLLDQTESFLARVEQSPSESMLNALHPAMKALVAKELIGHADTDVKVAVASCISEITRITAPEAPYDDDLMKEVFRRIVEAFEKLDDISSRSYSRRVSILETVAKVRSCVVMLDLECDDLILEMFHHFLNTIRPNHSENIFNSMETIMTLVLEESEDISPELLTCLLDIVKKDNQDVLPIAHKLGEKVISNCTAKLKPYMRELVKSMGASLSQYSKIVALICQESSDGMEQNDANASGMVMGSAKMEQEVGCAEEVGTAADKSPRLLMSNGTAQIGNGELVVEQTSAKQRLERSRRNSESKSTSVGNIADSGNLESIPAKPESTSDLNTRKIRGRTTGHSRIDSDKETPALPRRKGRGKEADSTKFDGPSGKIADSAKKDELQLLSGSDNGTGSAASPDHSESPDATRPRRGRPPGSKVSSKRGGGSAVAGESASPSGQKGSLGSGHSQDETLPLKDVDSKKELEGSGDSEGKSSRRTRKKHPDNADDGEAPTTVTGDLEMKPQRQSRKASTIKVTDGESSQKQLKSNSKQQKEKRNAQKDVAAESKELVSSPKSTLKAKSKYHGGLEASANAKTKRKRGRGTEEGSDTPTQSAELDEGLVGSRIKVWWPDDKAFYDGVVASFEPVLKKHKILYDDGDIEILSLKNERWKFILEDAGKDRDHSGLAEDISSPDAASELRRDKKAKTNSVPKHLKMEMPRISGAECSSIAKRKGRPKGGITNPGMLSGDESPRSSGKPEEKAASRYNDDTPKTGSRLKKDTGSKSKYDTPKTGDKSKDETSKTDGKSGDDNQKTGNKSKDDLPKSSRKSKDDTPKTDSKSEDDMIGTGGKAKEAGKGKSSEETPRSGRKFKGSSTSRKTGDEAKANGTSEKGKSKVQEAHSDSVKAQESEASTGKKRKRRGQS